MRVFKNEVKLVLLILSLAIYLTFLFANFTYADPQGTSVTNLSTETYTVTPGGRSDSGGTITTVSLSVDQQDNNWKAYVGNITGTLVLRDSDGWSIFEWTMNSSSLTGNVYVSRNDSVSWDDLRCAVDSVIDSEQTALGINTNATDSINNTFNYSIHKTMATTTLAGDIANGTCQSTATWVNGSVQVMNQSTTYFQEILLDDTTNLIYATFVDQDAWGFDNNESVNGTNMTYDFQIIVAENSSSTGSAYYFYAEIS